MIRYSIIFHEGGRILDFVGRIESRQIYTHAPARTQVPFSNVGRGKQVGHKFGGQGGAINARAHLDLEHTGIWNALISLIILSSGIL